MIGGADGGAFWRVSGPFSGSSGSYPSPSHGGCDNGVYGGERMNRINPKRTIKKTTTMKPPWRKREIPIMKKRVKAKKWKKNLGTGLYTIVCRGFSIFVI